MYIRAESLSMRRVIGRTVNGTYQGEPATPEQQAAFAAMLAARTPPALDTDTAHYAGMGTLDKQYGGDEKYLARITANAKRFGYTPSINDVYDPTLVRPEIGPGDPEAFVKTGGGRYYREQLLARRRRSPRPPSVKLAEDIVRKKCRDAVRREPALQKLPKRELRELIVAKHGHQLSAT